MSRIDPAFLFELRPGNGITVQAFELCHKHTNSHMYFTVRVLLNGREVFPKGQRYAGVSYAAGHSIDGKAAKELALSLASMKPGDTDSDYFADYTPEQLAFAEEHGEYLSYVAGVRYGEN